LPSGVFPKGECKGSAFKDTLQTFRQKFLVLAKDFRVYLQKTNKKKHLRMAQRMKRREPRSLAARNGDEENGKQNKEDSNEKRGNDG
jgi:hypothetical protein